MKKILSILLAILVMATSCVCAVPVSAAEGCVDHSDLKSTTYEYTANPDGTDATYVKKDFCYDADCPGTIVTGSAGSTNTCLRCHSRTLVKMETIYPNCIKGGYTEYTCSKCGTYQEAFTGKLAHKYVETVYPATCTTDGYTHYECNCTRYGATANAAKNGKYIPAKGHTIGKAGTTCTYVYDGDECTISGVCMECVHEGVVSEEKKYATPDICPDCGNNVVSKTVVIPADCTEGATITYDCPKEGCNPAPVKALAVGHEVKKTTYNYTNGEYVSTTVECYRCGEKTFVESEHNKSTACELCNGILTERIVVAPTCEKNGYTQAKCGQCGLYTESTRPATSHNVKVGEWNFDNEAGVYTFGASCRNYGCKGYYTEGQIGILGKCVKCQATGKLTYKKVVFSDCISKEYTIYRCKQCSPDADGLIVGTKTRGHNTVTEKVEATCQTEGGTVTTCKNCYRTSMEDVIPATGHALDVTVIDYVAGISRGVCKLCNADIEKAVTIVEKCEKCGGNLKQKVFVKPDCSGEGTNGHTKVYCENGCSNNNYAGYYIPDSSIIQYAHVYGDWTVTKPATCSASGEKVRYCSLCNGEDKETIPANTTASGDPKHIFVIMEKGYPATCTEDGLSDYKYCSQCGMFVTAKVIPATGHLLSPGTVNEKFCNRCYCYIVDELEDGTVKVPMLDANGKQMYQISGYEVLTDANGNTQYEVEVDEKGNIIYDEDVNGNKLPRYKLDEAGNKIPVYKLDSYGNRIPIYAKDSAGNLIPLYKTVACSCMHHNNDGLAQFFFKFIIFFCQILGINKVCDCGVIHY